MSRESGARQELRVLHAEDVLPAQQDVVRFASRLPFDAADLGRIALIASELASNLVKHGGGGSLTITLLEAPRGVRVTAEDHGPGIPDVPQAMQAGFSTAGSYGDGLAALRELADRFALESTPGRGTRVEVDKWLA